MEAEAKNIIKYHKNPLTKVSFIGPKLFFKDASSEAQKIVWDNLEILENVLRHNKVDRRSARAKAEWQPSLNLAKVNKVVKGLLENFGYQDKSGIYMYPEEMLYLVETNRMEISLNGVPLSIQECYDTVLNTPDVNLKIYRVYKKLVFQGHRVIRYSEIIRKRNNIKLKNKKSEHLEQSKRKLEDSEKGCSKSQKIAVHQSNTDTLERKKKYIDDIFEKLRKNVPRQYIPEESEDSNPDYCVFSSTNTSRVDWDFNVYICETFAIDQLKSSSTRPAIYAICNGENISFYKIDICRRECNDKCELPTFLRENWTPDFYFEHLRLQYNTNTEAYRDELARRIGAI